VSVVLDPHRPKAQEQRHQRRLGQHHLPRGGPEHLEQTGRRRRAEALVEPLGGDRHPELGRRARQVAETRLRLVQVAEHQRLHKRGARQLRVPLHEAGEPGGAIRRADEHLLQRRADLCYSVHREAPER
jgi:hypothetical protein